MDRFLADQKRKRDIALAVFLGSSFLFGIVDLLLYQSESWTSTSWILDAIVGVIAIGAWCRYDSHIQGYTVTGDLRILIWLLALVGVPKYLVRSRGWLRAAKIGFGLPVFLLSIGLYYASWYGSFWIASSAGYFRR